MVMCSPGYIFQSKLDKLLGYIKGVKTYIDDIIILSKDLFKNHIEQLRIIFCILCAAGSKVNAPNCSFWLKDVPYLGYVIIIEGIKPVPKKL